MKFKLPMLLPYCHENWQIGRDSYIISSKSHIQKKNPKTQNSQKLKIKKKKPIFLSYSHENMQIGSVSYAQSLRDKTI